MPRPFRMTRTSRRSAFLIVTVLAIAGLVLAGFQLTARTAGPAKARTAAHIAVNGALAAARPAAAIAPAISCAQLAAQNFATVVPGAPTQITAAVPVTYNGASFCDVQGVQPPQLQFDLKLPVSTWTGRYVQAGCGGYCGSVGSVAPQAAVGCPKVTGNELALATDNEGHTGSGFNALFGYDPGMRVSYAYSSEHNLALAAKAIIKAYFGQGPSYSY